MRNAGRTPRCLAGALTLIAALAAANGVDAALINPRVGLDGPERFLGMVDHVGPVGADSTTLTTINWEVTVIEQVNAMCAPGSSEILIRFTHLVAPHAGDIMPNGPFTFTLGCQTPGVHVGFFFPEIVAHPALHSDKLTVRYAMHGAGVSQIQIQLEHVPEPATLVSTGIAGVVVGSLARWRRGRPRPGGARRTR